MSANGKVLNLLDDRYYRTLHDVTDRIEPFPTLVPYDFYRHNVVVYKMDTSHEVYMGLVQDFIDRTARTYNKELWSWAVQWKVEVASGTTPVFKKLRIGTPGSADLPTPPLPTPRQPFLTIMGRYLDSQLLQEGELLCILLDIVTVESPFVPNFIEFLYRWIDFYEGDGTALKLALEQEIPTLWDFEYHPALLENREFETDVNGHRKKPDLAAFQHQAEQFERLHYKEVRFGVLEATKEDVVNPHINVPKDTKKKTRYLAACFRSREKAKQLLLQVGLSMQQISNYVRFQTMHPRETSQELGGKGFTNYIKEKRFAQEDWVEKHGWAELKARYREGLISNRLLKESQLATLNAAITDDNFDAESGHLQVAPPLIPPTPLRPYRTGLFSAPSVDFSTSQQHNDVIRSIPAFMCRRLRSNAFAYAHPNRFYGDGSDDDYSYPAPEDMEDEGDPMDISPRATTGHTDLPRFVWSDDQFLNYIRSATSGQIRRLMPLLSRYIEQPFIPIIVMPQPPPSQNIQQPPMPDWMPQPPGQMLPATTALAGASNVDPLPPPRPGLFGPLQGTTLPMTAHPGMGASREQRSALAGGGAGALAPPSITVPPLHPQPPPGFISHNPLQTGFGPPRQGNRRAAPPSLDLEHLGATRSATTKPDRIPVQIYFKQVVQYASKTVSKPVNQPTDAIMLGYMKPETGIPGDDGGHIELTTMIFLPTSTWANSLKRVQTGKNEVLETFPAPSVAPFYRGTQPAGGGRGLSFPHMSAYSKLWQAYALMRNHGNRERELTKRWRVTAGLITETDRGSVWEGWGMDVNRGIGMSLQERRGAVELGEEEEQEREDEIEDVVSDDETDDPVSDDE